MSTIEEIQPLTQRAVVKLLKKRQEQAHRSGGCRRKVTRWPFPGTVELWLPGDHGQEWYELATCENLSVQGAGIRSDNKLPVGMEVGIAIHEPEISFHGRAVVRHCTETEGGFYTVGVEFQF